MAGGNERGDDTNQLWHPHGLDIDDDNQSIVIADWWNQRIVEWKIGASNGKVIAGGEVKEIDWINCTVQLTFSSTKRRIVS